MSELFAEAQDAGLEGYAAEAPTQGALALKQFAAGRLAEHRNRRAAMEAQEAEMSARVRARRENVRGEARRGASKVRDAVAARYEQSVSYREFLAQEAEKALERAQAEAEVAARNVRALEDAQRDLLSELEQYRAAPTPRQQMLDARRAETRSELAHALADLALGAQELAREAALTPAEPMFFDEREAADLPALRVQMVGGLHTATAESLRCAKAVDGSREMAAEVPGEMAALDAELAFRHSEGFERQSLGLTAIPGNLIEFPRQLVASRKVRPRLAEGPLRDEAGAEPQLRIFEVEPELVSYEPVEEDASTPEWHGMMLDAALLPADDPYAAQGVLPAETQVAIPIQAATLERRGMAMATDAILIAMGFVGFVTVFARLAPRVVQAMSPRGMGMFAGVALAVAYLVYQLLFFTLSHATPGMRLARIGLCTFADDNPTRRAMRVRLLLTLVAAAPLGLGIFWMAVDGERLGWHDRMSRMYPREY